MNRAPRDVVDRLLKANPNALFVQDTEGWTPLHVIILYGHGHDGDGDGDERTTLRIIRQGGRIGGCLPSRYVGSPLHLACRHGCSQAVLAELLRASPNQARVRNEAGMTPANLAWKTFVRQKSPMGLKEPSDAQSLLEQLCLLLSATATAGAPSKQPDRPPTAGVPSFGQALDFQQRYADETDFVSLLLWFHPRVLREPRAFPVHRACAYEPAGKPVLPGLLPPTHTLPQDPLRLVLDRLGPDPVALACSTRDDAGRLPLHWALSAGRRSWRAGGLQDLVHWFPGSLLVRDPATGLFPFLLAAASASAPEDLDIVAPGGRTGFESSPRARRDAVLVVETAFELLRRAPQVLR
jgi:hypothetical protein